MATRKHRLTRADFLALARGGGPPTAIETLRSGRRTRNLVLLRYVAQRIAEAAPAFELLRTVAGTAPQVVEDVLRQPFAGAWINRSAHALRRGEAADHSGLVAIAAAAAIRAGVRATIRVPPLPRMALPSLGTVPGPLTGDIDVADLEWEPAPRIVMPDGTAFLLENWSATTPFPALSPLPVAPGVDVARWQDRIGAGWDLLARRHGPVAEEFAAVVSTLTPLRGRTDRMSSATLAEALGCVFLSLSENPELVAVTLAHELQHAKLIALMDLFPLLTFEKAELFYAPWRDDPRPLAGLLHGTYAHLAVAGFWRRQAAVSGHVEAFAEFARWRAAGLLAARTMLGTGRLTEHGRLFVHGIAGVFAEWSEESVPAAATRTAQRRAGEHRSRWLAEHGSHSSLTC